MGKPAQQKMNLRVPLWTLSLCGLAVGAFLLPNGMDVWSYDRQALLAGEWWRVLTGHLTHYTAQHLAINLLVVAVAGGIIEQRGRSSLPLLLLLSTVSISLSLFLMLPQLTVYGGLSGVACAEVTYLCWLGKSEQGLWQKTCIGLLLMFFGKTVWEFASSASLLTMATSQPFVPVPLAHLVGGLTGLLMAQGYLWRHSLDCGDNWKPASSNTSFKNRRQTSQ